jgi:hypothetical protein
LRLARHASPEENAFLGIQFMKAKFVLHTPSVADQLRSWLLQEGLATIVAPEALPPEYWVEATGNANEGRLFEEKEVEW